jgi:hypothetical protein
MKIKFKTGHFINDGGVETWCLNGKLHREDGPALIAPNGHEEWHFDGQRHRANGPAQMRLGHPDMYWWKDDFLGYDEEGFSELWDRLNDEQREDPILLKFFPGHPR